MAKMRIPLPTLFQSCGFARFTFENWPFFLLGMEDRTRRTKKENIAQLAAREDLFCERQ
jgi:hypothetical protein